MPTNRLALEGGTPIRETLLPYAAQDIHEDDIRAVAETLKEPFITCGPKIQEFEEAVCAFTGAKYGVAFCNGTAALHAAAFLAGVTEKKNAITTPLTFVSSANAALTNHGEIQFADIEKETLNIDPKRVEPLINKDTTAVIAVDYAGHPCSYDALNTLCRHRNVRLIADACHSLGATYKGNPVGSLADFTVLSFHPAKLITTGEGGMVLCNDEGAAQRLKNFRHLGAERRHERITNLPGDWYYEVRVLGGNFRITDFQAALGLSQLKRIESFLARRREIVQLYHQAFGGLKELHCPVEEPAVQSAWHIYPVRFDLNALSADRKRIFEAYRAENIGVQVHYIPVYQHPLYAKRYRLQGKNFSVTENAYNRILSLPLFPSMSDQDVKDVIDATEKIVTRFRRKS